MVTMTSLPEKTADAPMGAIAPSTTDSVPAEVMVLLNCNTMVWPLPMVRGSTVTLGGRSEVSIGKSKVPAIPWLLRETPPTNDNVANADGVTATVAEDALAPTALLAMTAQVYGVALMRFRTLTGENVAEPVKVPGLQVAV